MNILDLTHDIVAEMSKSKETFQDTFLEKYLLDAFKDLCRETYCYTEEISDVSVIDTSEYTLTIATANAKLVGFVSGKWGTGDNSKELKNTNKRELDEQDYYWQVRKGEPTKIIYDGEDKIKFNKIPDTTTLAGVTIKFLVAIAPDSIDSVVPKVIEYRYLETIKDYIKWKVYESPDFLNLKLSEKFERKYEKKRDVLKSEILEEQIGNTSVRQRNFLYS